jgi:hypothetical protein
MKRKGTLHCRPSKATRLSRPTRRWTWTSKGAGSAGGKADRAGCSIAHEAAMLSPVSGRVSRCERLWIRSSVVV